MLSNIQAYWYLYILLLVLIIITAFVCKKAFGAAARHSKEVNEQLARAKRNKELREAYDNLDERTVLSAPAATLFEGVALNLEAQCQKAEDGTAFYSGLNKAQGAVYSFYYLANDAKEQSLSAFFKQSSRPLTSDAVEAAKAIFSSEIYEIIKNMFDRYDEENETASVIPEEIEKLDAEFSSLTAETDFYVLGGEYIKKNASEFI